MSEEAAAPVADAAAAQAADAETDALTAGVQNAEAAERYREQIRGGVRRGTELSAAALASAPYLLFERDARGHIRIGSAKLETPKDRAAYQLFDRVPVKFSGGAPFSAGDTVDVVRSDGLISFKGRSAQLVTRVGRALVEEVSGGSRLTVRINEMWGVVKGGESIVPTTRFAPVYCDNIVKPDAEIRGSVVRRIENTVTPHMHQYFIIDKGERDGVQIGDFFKVRERRNRDRSGGELLEAQVVNVTPVSATLVIQKLFKNSLNVGDQAFLNRRPVTTVAARASAAPAAAAVPAAPADVPAVSAEPGAAPAPAQAQ